MTKIFFGKMKTEDVSRLIVVLTMIRITDSLIFALQIYLKTVKLFIKI